MLSYARFETLRTIRNPGFLFLVTVVPVALYVIGVRGISEGESIDGIPASAWYLASATAIGAIGAAITGSGARLAAERASGWSRQLRVTPLTETGWLVGRLLASVLIVVPVIVVVAILALVVGDVDLAAGQWLGLIAATLFGSISMALIGLIVGLVFRFEAAQAAQAVAFVLLAFLGGAFAQTEDPPDALKHIVQISPSYHLVALVRIAVGSEGSVAVHVAALTAASAVLAAAVVVIRRRLT